MKLLPLVAAMVALATQHQVTGFSPSNSIVTSSDPLTSFSQRKRSPGSVQMSVQDEEPNKKKRPLPIRRAFLASSLVAGAQLFMAQAYTPSGFKRIPTQFIAALGDPNANSGQESNEWGRWRLDPGPRGVWLRQYKDQLQDGVAPAGWKFDSNDWWLEEHGLIMEAPEFPLPPGRYLVTGGRMVTTGLTITANGGWKLDDNAKLYDVTHLPCRSARYHPNSGNGSPLTAKTSDFPVSPGAVMPKVAGCDKQDYAVLFVIGVEA